MEQYLIPLASSFLSAAIAGIGVSWTFSRKFARSEETTRDVIELKVVSKENTEKISTILRDIGILQHNNQNLLEKILESQARQDLILEKFDKRIEQTELSIGKMRESNATHATCPFYGKNAFEITELVKKD